MFTAFIDDSGTAPDQLVAIAAALIVPTKRIVALGQEWETFREKEGFSDFHTSECVARNRRSEFADWHAEKVRRVIARTRIISRKYGARAFSFAVNKQDYDEIVPPDIKAVGGGYHYTWAIHHLIAFIDKWARDTQMIYPMEYVFDWMNGSQKRNKQEIETVLLRAEHFNPGRYGNYSFKQRRLNPGLQCVDMLAWTYFQLARFKFHQVPLPSIADEQIAELERDRYKGEWMTGITITKENLTDWVSKEACNEESIALRKKWTSVGVGNSTRTP